MVRANQDDAHNVQKLRRTPRPFEQDRMHFSAIGGRVRRESKSHHGVFCNWYSSSREFNFAENVADEVNEAVPQLAANLSKSALMCAGRDESGAMASQ